MAVHLCFCPPTFACAGGKCDGECRWKVGEGQDKMLPWFKACEAGNLAVAIAKWRRQRAGLCL